MIHVLHPKTEARRWRATLKSPSKATQKYKTTMCSTANALEWTIADLPGWFSPSGIPPDRLLRAIAVELDADEVLWDERAGWIAATFLAVPPLRRKGKQSPSLCGSPTPPNESCLPSLCF